MSVPRRIPTLTHYCTDQDVTWGMVGVSSSCALLGGFAIGARVSLLYDSITPIAKCQRVLVLVLFLVFYCRHIVMQRQYRLLFVFFCVCLSRRQRNRRTLAAGISYRGFQNGMKFSSLIEGALVYFTTQISELWHREFPGSAKILTGIKENL